MENVVYWSTHLAGYIDVVQNLDRVYVYPKWSSNIYVSMFAVLSSFSLPFNLRKSCVINNKESLARLPKNNNNL